MVNKKLQFKYIPKQDTWDKLLIPSKSIYQEELNTLYEVEALDTYEKDYRIDAQLNRVPKKGERWFVDKERLEVLLGNNKYEKAYVKLINTFKKDETKTIIKYFFICFSYYNQALNHLLFLGRYFPHNEALCP